MLPFYIVVAMDMNSGIGKNGGLPWNLPGDLKHFKETTGRTQSPQKKNAVIMGRKTWESIPDKFRPLPGRINVVLTRSKDYPLPQGVVRAESLDGALAFLNELPLKRLVEKVFVIGGAQVFQEAVGHMACRTIYLTHVLSNFECDTFFPSLPSQFHVMAKTPEFAENGHKYYFAEYMCFDGVAKRPNRKRFLQNP